MDPNFETWLDEVNRLVLRYSKAATYEVLDAGIPYRLGWCPDRAARALLGMNLKDKSTLINESKTCQHH